MVKYKIYVKNNYFYLEKITPKEIFSALSKNVEVNPNNTGKLSYRIYNLRDWDSTTSISLDQIFKENGDAYTQNEWETFYTGNTGNFNSGSASLDPELLETINSADHYKGFYNILINSPALSDGTGVFGEYFRMSEAGTRDFGSGAITVGVDDILAFDGASWYKHVDNNQTSGDDFLYVNAFKNLYNY